MSKAIVVPYKHEHIEVFIDQKINAPAREYFLKGDGRDLEKRANAVTVMLDGVPQVCGAVDKIWENRGLVWCLFNERSKQNFIPVFRAMKGVLDTSDFERIEIAIQVPNKVACRRAEMLGFKLECANARKYLPSGEDCAIYVRIKGDA